MSTNEIRISNDTGAASLTSVDMELEVVQALIRAAKAHGHHEERIGKPDPNWPGWYAEYMVREQAGEALPE